jgi:hypothetical protein
MDEARSLLPYLFLHHPVFLIRKEIHPSIKQFFCLESENPLNSLKLSLTVRTGHSNLERVCLLRIGEVAGIERHAHLIFWVGYVTFEGSVFEVVDVVEDSSGVIVDEESLVSKKTDCFTVLLDQRVIYFGLTELLLF